MTVDRSTPLRQLLGAIAPKLAKARDLHTVGDLLDFLPRRYIDVNTAGRLGEFHEGEHAVLVARVLEAHTRPMRQRRGKMLEAVIEDADGDLARLVFFRAWGHEQRLVPGADAIFRGKLDRYRGGFQLSHPDYTIVSDPEAVTLYSGGLVPVYLHTAGATDMQLTQCLKIVLDAFDGADPLPQFLRERHRLVDEATAYRLIHLPADRADVGRGKRRLRFEEALVIQTALAGSRARYDADGGTPRRPRAGGLLAQFDERLPFELTAGQQSVGEQIAADLARSTPMHRLLQGEVGSGKTIVALRAMLATIDSGAQTALLAPTEVLAQQHYRSIRAMLGDLADGGMLGAPEHATQVVLLTGSMTKAQRKKALLDIATADVGIVVGTHALLQENVLFPDLGLVVVDEQHRFGVEQRDVLRAKAIRPPHMLVMTATPIPRTVAMTVFGDMDTSELTELPKGRQSIASHVVPQDRPGWLDRVWQRVGEQVAQGHQAYVVCPRIGGDEKDVDVLEEFDGSSESDTEGAQRPPLTGVYEQIEKLRDEPHLRGLNIEMLHGRMSGDDKDAVMTAFNAGKIDVLVSTTVIEVGVDVPNATVMVIIDADRFGISQLHQLRGRVGRGSAGGLCFLVTSTDNPATMERLEAVAATSNGFDLAELDLTLRNEGDILGASQSGRRSQLRLLRLTHPKDVELIELAREDARQIVSSDPDLSIHPGLAALVADRLDDEQAAFLERG